MKLKKYYDYVKRNENIEYSVTFEPLPLVRGTHKWVGAQKTDHCIYGIPNDTNVILKHTKLGNFYIGDLGNSLFKWTGGCIWNGFLYAFPRTSDYLLKMSLDTEHIELIPVADGYGQEHHYGGICTPNGLVYQPPRDSNHILVWDLKTEKTRRIDLVPKSSSKTFRYCGSILHPNGNLYFLPEIGERIIRLETKSGEWGFIGETMNAMVFDAKIAVDGNIYGFSAYCYGILKLNVETEHAEMIHTKIWPGAYGTKLGINGHLYSIPGDGRNVWDYDPLTDCLKSIYQFSDDSIAKYAGGVSLPNGDICAMPARENQLLKLKADIVNAKIPDEIYQDYFVDCY